ncbi:cupin domain-containing protein [Terriglobus saanensis]|nr:cupin domain-containing protein [Terriglobus saanensis]
MMKASFTSVLAIPAIERGNEHGGLGPISFRRLLRETDFKAPIDFVDYTIVPSGSAIGMHQHVGNEEMYFVVSGEPLMRVNGYEARLAKGSLSVVRDGESHELINDRGGDVEILVIQVRV